MDKKEEENIIIDNILKEGADKVDVDLNDAEIDEIWKEADIDVSQDKTLDFLNIKDDVTMKELLIGIDVDIKKAIDPDHLIKNIIKEMNIVIITKKEDILKIT